MSGVFGLVRADQGDETGILIRQMASSLHHRPWFVNETWVDEHDRCALGRIGIGIFNRPAQPVWNRDRTVALVMAGEIYNSDQVDLGDGDSDEDCALRLYETYGAGFATKLNGAFVIAIWDKIRRKLIITNDRFAFYNLFYACYKGRLLFSPEVKGILCDPEFRKEIDWVALAQYMRFQHLLGNRTFFEGIHLLPGASTLVFDAQNGQLSVSPYWSYDEIPARENLTFREAVEETGRLLRRAVIKLTAGDLRPGVFLSGGLDGRTIIGLVERRPVASLAFGEADSRDVVYSRRIARAVGSEHAWVKFPDGKWVLEQIQLHLELTEGFHSWIHMHGMSALSLAREMMDVNLSGWDGGTVMGHSDSIEPQQCDPVTEEAFLIRQFEKFNNFFTWPGLNEVEEKLLYQEPVARRMVGLAFDSMREEFKRYMNFRRETRQEFFYIDNHCRRLTHNMIIFGRSHIEQRFPFFDYELIDFLYSLPPHFRADRRLYLAVINQEIPSLTRIPYDHDDLPPVVKGRTWYKFWRKLQLFLNRHMAPIFPEYKTLYADYENYLRTDLRSWGEEILFDHRTKDRGIFNPSFLDTMWKRHMSRQEYHTIGKIAPIMTYEMMLRRFYD